MGKKDPSKIAGISPIWLFFAWLFLFGIAYAQSPLFTSNQNQYFFFGLARSSMPLLQQDWLYSTTDIVPLFSGLVYLTRQIFHTHIIFYLEYFVLFGIYLYSLWSICRTVFAKLDQKTHKLFFAFLVVLLHSAALRYLISISISPDWEFLIEGGVAGQRLLGDVFQPSTFGVFLVLGIALFLQHQHYPAVIATVFAALVHPTYILSAAVLILTFTLITWKEDKSLKRSLGMGILALLLVAPIVLYVANQFLGVDPAVNTAGQQIVVEYRQPHHMIIANWLDWRVLIKILLFVFALWLVRNHRLFWVLLGPGVFVIGATVIQAIIQSPALAMLFPWRFSVVLVPLSSALIAAWMAQQDYSWISPRRLQWLSISGLCILAAIGMIKFYQSWDAKAHSPEQDIYQEVRTLLTEDQLYMIPLKMQDFRLETGAPIVVEYKAAPQSAAGVLEWYERVQEVDHFYSGLPWGEACRRLPELIHRYHVTHIIIPLEDYTEQTCLKEISRTGDYAIFQPDFGN